VVSQFHIPEAIEPFSAEITGAPRAIVLGKKSGLASIELKLKELDLELARKQHPAVLAAVKRLSVAQKGLVSDAQFREVVATFNGAD
jgi:isopropylmalate/homocitrate/citramalate synthase